MMRIDTVHLKAPVRTSETDAFWDAASEQRLLYGACRACGQAHYYPRKICPFCMSADVAWPASAGRGSIYAFSIFRKGQPPYVSAWVMLDEGVAVLSNLTDCETDMLRIGQAVELAFHPAPDSQLVPVFTPV